MLPKVKTSKAVDLDCIVDGVLHNCNGLRGKAFNRQGCRDLAPAIACCSIKNQQKTVAL
jgi:hypothetical protein